MVVFNLQLSKNKCCLKNIYVLLFSATVTWEQGTGPGLMLSRLILLFLLLFLFFFNIVCPQIIRCEVVPAGKCRRPLVTQMHDSKIKFPLPCRVSKQGGALIQANRPNTYFE